MALSTDGGARCESSERTAVLERQRVLAEGGAGQQSLGWAAALALAEATPELTPRPRFVAMARWYRGSVLDRTRDCLDGRRPSPAPAPLQRLRPRPSTGQHRRWWSIRTRTPKKQYLEKRRVVTCPGQSARRRRLFTLVISHHALLTHRHVLEVRRLLRLAVPAPPGPRVTLGARTPSVSFAA